MTPERRRELVLLRQARDRIDRRFAEPLDVATIARGAFMSTAHFSRRFRAVYGESPAAYLSSRRIERAAALLSAGSSVTDACIAVGFTSLGSFSARFLRATGVAPSRYRPPESGRALPGCVTRSAARVSRIREAGAPAAA